MIILDYGHIIKYFLRGYSVFFNVGAAPWVSSLITGAHAGAPYIVKLMLFGDSDYLESSVDHIHAPQKDKYSTDPLESYGAL